MDVSRLLKILGFIAIGVASRLIPHLPNCTAMNALALFSAFYIGNRWISLATVVTTLFLSDWIIGFHSTMPFVYLSFGLIILMGYQIKREKTLLPMTLGASLLFFFLTNFGEWMTGSLYPRTLEGLELCYIAALPFLTYQILGDLMYGALLFGCMHLMFKVHKDPAKVFAVFFNPVIKRLNMFLF